MIGKISTTPNKNLKNPSENILSEFDVLKDKKASECLI
jgi:hypothetical protein